MRRALMTAGAAAAVTTLAATALFTAAGRGDVGDSSSPREARSGGYVWTRVAADYGWGRIAYVLNLVAFEPGLWAFEGGAAHVSRDGRAWAPGSGRAGWRGIVLSGNIVVHDQKLWALGGIVDRWDTWRNDVWSSADGRSWSCVTAGAGWSPRRGHVNVTFDGKLWVLGGSARRPHNDVWSSPDGVRWARITEHAPWPPRAAHRAAVFRNRIWLLGESGEVWSSADGARWTHATTRADWGPRRGFAVAAFDDRLWVLGGTGRNDVWYSEDGRRWDQQTAGAGWAPRAGLSATAWGDRLWIMGGKTGVSANSNPQDIWCMAPAGEAQRRTRQREDGRRTATLRPVFSSSR